MKKPRLHPLILLTILFLTFLAGLFLGRNYNRTGLQVSTPLSREDPFQSQSLQAAAPDETRLCVNINTADAAVLQTLPGIGESTAQKIIDYRNANGPFRFPTDLLRVEGIGETKLAAILDYITVQEELS